MIFAQERFLLQQMGGPPPVFLGGTIRLNIDYSGPILRVHRTSSQFIDVYQPSEIGEFCKGGFTGASAILYDQSGNTNHLDLIQPNATGNLVFQAGRYARNGNSGYSTPTAVKVDTLKKDVNGPAFKLFNGATGVTVATYGAILGGALGTLTFGRFDPFRVMASETQYLIQGLHYEDAYDYYNESTQVTSRIVPSGGTAFDLLTGTGVNVYQSLVLRWPFGSSMLSNLPNTGARCRINGIEQPFAAAQADSTFDAVAVNTEFTHAEIYSGSTGSGVASWHMSVLGVWPYRFADDSQQLSQFDAWCASKL